MDEQFKRCATLGLIALYRVNDWLYMESVDCLNNERR